MKFMYALQMKGIWRLPGGYSAGMVWVYTSAYMERSLQIILTVMKHFYSPVVLFSSRMAPPIHRAPAHTEYLDEDENDRTLK